jgi:hypothetical protein
MKPEATTGQRLAGVAPAPAAPHEEGLSALRERAVAAFFTEVDPVTDNDRESLSKFFPTLTPGELETVEEWAGNQNASRLWMVHVGLKKALGQNFGRDYLRVADYLEGKEIEEMVGEYYVAAFQKYEGLSPLVDGAAYPKERFEQFVAVTETVLSMIELSRTGSVEYDEFSLDASNNDYKYEWLPFIRDEKLRSIIVDSQRNEAALRVIQERKIVDADAIRGILNGSGYAPLGNGAL